MAQNKRAGRKSLAQNDFLPPEIPTGVSGTNIGTSRPYNNGAVSVSFTGHGETSYTVTASTGQTATGSSSPILVTNLPSATNITFKVKATNNQGTSADSSPSANVFVTTVPATPSAPTAQAQVNYDTVSWTAPSDGGSAITGYIWASSDGKTNLAGGTPGGGPTTSTSVNVTQEAGTAQTYTVYAINTNGNGGTSPSSNSVTTISPYFPYFPYFPGFGPFFPYFAPPFFPYFPGFGGCRGCFT